jgi:hypothetical protein
MSDGYKRTIDNEKISSIEAWRQTRLLAFLLVRDNLKDKHMTMYDFYPLPGDPTKEELEQARKDEAEKESKWMKNVIAQFRKHKL